MTGQLLNIFISVLSGIITAFLLWLSAHLIKTKFTPWFVKQAYRGLNIKGEWSAIVYANDIGDIVDDEQESDSTCTYILNITEQIGGTVSGIFSQDFKKKEQHRFGQYKVHGSIQDGTVVLILLPNNSTKSTFGTLLLIVDNGGNCLKGVLTYTVAGNQVSQCDLSLSKKN